VKNSESKPLADSPLHSATRAMVARLLGRDWEFATRSAGPASDSIDPHWECLVQLPDGHWLWGRRLGSQDMGRVLTTDDALAVLRDFASSENHRARLSDTYLNLNDGFQRIVRLADLGNHKAKRAREEGKTGFEELLKVILEEVMDAFPASAGVAELWTEGVQDRCSIGLEPEACQAIADDPVLPKLLRGQAFVCDRNAPHNPPCTCCPLLDELGSQIALGFPLTPSLGETVGFVLVFANRPRIEIVRSELMQIAESLCAIGAGLIVGEQYAREREELDLRRLAIEQDKREHWQRASYEIAHQIRSPLFAQAKFLQVLSEDLHTGQIDSGEVQDLIAKAERARSRIERLITQVLDLARNVQPVLGKCNVAACIDDVWADLRIAEPEAGQVCFEVQGLRTAKALADHALLTGILDVLLRNAVLYATPHDGKHPEIVCTVDEHRGSGDGPCPDLNEPYVSLLISDNGPGLPEQMVGTLAEPFKPQARETGLGLAIACRKAAAMGAELKCLPDAQCGLGGATFALGLRRWSAINQAMEESCHG